MPSDLDIRVAEHTDMPRIEHNLGANQAFFYRNRLTQRCLVLSAWLHGEPVAALCVSFEDAEEQEIREHLPGVPLLYRLYVRDDLRSRGIGSALLRHAEDLLTGQGHTAVAVGVDVTNHRAIKLYSGRGYAEWDHGEIATVLESYSDAGELETLPDLCKVFVKRLAT